MMPMAGKRGMMRLRRGVGLVYSYAGSSSPPLLNARSNANCLYSFSELYLGVDSDRR